MRNGGRRVKYGGVSMGVSLFLNLSEIQPVPWEEKYSTGIKILHLLDFSCHANMYNTFSMGKLFPVKIHSKTLHKHKVWVGLQLWGQEEFCSLSALMVLKVNIICTWWFKLSEITFRSYRVVRMLWRNLEMLFSLLSLYSWRKSGFSFVFDLPKHFLAQNLERTMYHWVEQWAP